MDATHASKFLRFVSYIQNTHTFTNNFSCEGTDFVISQTNKHTKLNS